MATNMRVYKVESLLCERAAFRISKKTAWSWFRSLNKTGSVRAS